MRYYVVADVHGYYTALADALKKAGFFDDPHPHKLVILGDLFDRGKEAQEVQSFAADLLERDAVILIRGNHEDFFEAFVTEDEGQPFSYHISNGTYDTALQLTGFDRGLALIRNDKFAEAARNTVYYKTIIPAMLDYYETEHYVFVHGWIPYLKERSGYSYIGDWRSADTDLWQASRWTNGMAACKTVCENDKTIVCGHWHASYGHAVLDNHGSEFGADADFHPYYGNGIIALDACTALSGFVNCVVLED